MQGVPGLGEATCICTAARQLPVVTECLSHTSSLMITLLSHDRLSTKHLHHTLSCMTCRAEQTSMRVQRVQEQPEQVPDNAPPSLTPTPTPKSGSLLADHTDSLCCSIPQAIMLHITSNHDANHE
jgi:hypothetical protein